MESAGIKTIITEVMDKDEKRERQWRNQVDRQITKDKAQRASETIAGK